MCLEVTSVQELLVDRSCLGGGSGDSSQEEHTGYLIEVKITKRALSQSPVFPLPVRSNLLESRGGKITCWYVCGSKQTLNTSYNSPSRVFVPWQRTTHASLRGPGSVGSRRGERSQHHFQAGRNTLAEHA